MKRGYCWNLNPLSSRWSNDILFVKKQSITIKEKLTNPSLFMSIDKMLKQEIFIIIIISSHPIHFLRQVFLVSYNNFFSLPNAVKHFWNLRNESSTPFCTFAKPQWSTTNLHIHVHIYQIHKRVKRYHITYHTTITTLLSTSTNILDITVHYPHYRLMTCTTK